MPIKSENRSRYPANWKEIREQILKRAGNRCEQCRVPNHSWIQRGFYHDKGTYQLEDGSVYDEDNGGLLCLRRATEYSGYLVKIVLTVAHLDHVPEHVDFSNLKALCQLHHLRYDAEHHRVNAFKTRHARKATSDLFGDL